MKIFNIFKREPKPVAEGYLPNEDGHRVYWARYGNIKGPTIINFHGGPGGGSRPRHTSAVNLKKFNVIVFDQRGCGKSEPKGKLENNNTQKTLSDAKRLLDMLGIKKVVARGSSWGSSLALLFTQKYPKMVSKIVLAAIFLANDNDDKWAFGYTGNIYPDMHEKMVGDKPKNKSLPDYYYGLITSKKRSDKIKAMKNFSSYEHALSSKDVKFTGEYDLERLESTKVFLYYFKNKYFLKEDQIMKDIKKIENKPCLIMHNRVDLVCPLVGAWRLHKVMKKSTLIIKPNFGHSVFKKYDMKNIKKEIAEFLEK